MESQRKYLFLSRFFYSDDSRHCVFPWFIPFSLLNSIPLLPFSELVLVVHWCLAILCGREPGSWEFQDLPLWLPPPRTDFHSDPNFWNSWKGIWLTCCGSDTQPLDQRTMAGWAVTHEEPVKAVRIFSVCLAPAISPRGNILLTWPHSTDSHWMCEVHYFRLHSQWIKY